MSRRILIFIIIILAAATTTSVCLLSRGESVPYSVSDSDKSLGEYYQQAKNLAPQEPQELTTTFLAVGDVSLSRNIAQTIKNKNDVLYPFRGMEEQFRSVDFTFGNLETPFSSSDAFTPKNTLVFNAPKANVAGLKEYNFKVITLANNHAYDQGLDGIITTAKILDDNGLLHTGIGKNLDEAWQPVIYESNGITIGILGASYSSVNDGGKAANNYVARIEDVSHLKSSILNLKSTTDFVVVAMHAGTEYVRKPNQSQIDFAHAAIDAGADIVIGHHSHWIQTIEEYQGKYIFYSLGNFIFDQNWSQETMEGLALKITLSKLGCHSGPEPESRTMNLDAGSQPGMTCWDALQGSRTPAQIKQIDLIPVIIKENCCPHPALSVGAQAILKKIGVTEQVIAP